MPNDISKQHITEVATAANSYHIKNLHPRGNSHQYARATHEISALMQTKQRPIDDDASAEYRIKTAPRGDVRDTKGNSMEPSMKEEPP